MTCVFHDAERQNPPMPGRKIRWAWARKQAPSVLKYLKNRAVGPDKEKSPHRMMDDSVDYDSFRKVDGTEVVAGEPVVSFARILKMDLQISVHRGHEHATRLRFFSGVAWSNPDALFRRVGLAPGMRCLDVRCGTGQATLPMARVAGTAGRVVGIDLEERLLAEGAPRRPARGSMPSSGSATSPIWTRRGPSTLSIRDSSSPSGLATRPRRC